MLEQKVRELRNQLVADINRPDGRWGIHGHTCVDDDYFLALIYVVGRMDELLSTYKQQNKETQCLKSG